MRTSIRFAALGLTLAVAAVVVPTAFADDASELNVLSWNICGEAGGKRGEAGYCAYRDFPQTKVDQIVELVEERDLDVIMLQEVCAEDPESHLERLKAELGDGWQFGNARGARPRPDEDGEPRTDCRGKVKGELGVAIAVKASDADFTSKNTLPADPEGQTLPTLCATTSDWPTKVCTTHILADPKDPRREQQIDNVRDYVWDARDNLILGGDFNMFPGSEELEPIAGSLDECDRRSYAEGDKTDEVTHHAWTSGNEHVYRKRDHIFATQAEDGSNFSACDSDTERMDTTENESGSGDPNGYSDHAPLTGTVTLGG
ncbi:MAG: endonuclease/exonuclease/phosphatase family protein [Stackebrandtia sp.]